ncbi:hypothetical protein [Achromobacter animicus]|uniref:hypothetical protein n=1 Tax=Achromobacter animicus TaxID=1389935 RepID=UPI00345E48C6
MDSSKPRCAGSIWSITNTGPLKGEAVQFFTGKPLENAHRAMADVKGGMDVYFTIQDLQRAEA